MGLADMENQEFLKISLGSAIAKTMEEMTFEEVEIDEVPKIPSAIQNDSLWAALPIKRPLAGKLVLDTSQIYARKLAEGIFGGPGKEFSDDIVRDVLAEILNTVAGSFINELVPKDQEFELGLPTTGLGKIPEPEVPVTSIRANVGGFYLTAVLTGKDFQEFQPKPNEG